MGAQRAKKRKVGAILQQNRIEIGKKVISGTILQYRAFFLSQGYRTKICVQKTNNLINTGKNFKLEGIFMPRFDTQPPGGLTPLETQLWGTKIRPEKLVKEVRRQREIALDIYLQSRKEFLHFSEKRCRHSRRMLPTADHGRNLFEAIRETLSQVLEKKSEGEWLSTLDSHEKIELFQALLVVSLKSTVIDRKKINLWKVKGRPLKLQNELREENNNAVRLARFQKVCSRGLL